MEKSGQISFGEMLKASRKMRGMTQQQLARKLAMHPNTIGAWERGDYLPATRGMILELARCLRLSQVETQNVLDAGLTTVASRCWLMSHNNWLLIFDNIEHVELATQFLPASREGSLLFTTQRPTLGHLAFCLTLPPLSLEESMYLLLWRAGSHGPHELMMSVHMDEDKTVRNLAIALGGLPLALEQVAACIEEFHCSFARFLHLFQHDALLRRNIRTETLSIHRLVQIVIKEKLSEMEQCVWIERLIRMFNLPVWLQISGKHIKNGHRRKRTPHRYLIRLLASG